MKLEMAIDFPGWKRNRNIKIRAQLRILKCIAVVKVATRKVLKHVSKHVLKFFELLLLLRRCI